ncbi:hypothetical protein SB766_06990 [Pseudomonas sp. SIMBA_077]
MDPVRESYTVFPAVTQPFWTWLTGRPAQDEQHKYSLGVIGFTAFSLLSYVAGILICLLSLRLSGTLCVLGVSLGWSLIVSGSRRMISTVAHQCIHNRFSGKQWLDRWLSEFFSVLTLTQSTQQYQEEHFLLHHRHDVFTTYADPAARFLHEVGLKPGMKVSSLWLHLLLNLFSPIFHLRFLSSRIKSHILSGGVLRKFFVVIYLLGWCWMIQLDYFSWMEWCIGFVLPVVIFYQNSVLLEFVSEHAWFSAHGVLTHSWHIHVTHSWGRFCGRKVPVRRAGFLRHLLNWIGWAVEHLFYHLPVRVLILPGDLPQHDFHHRHPGTKDWVTAAYAREQDSLHVGKVQPPPYKEFWGLHAAIQHVFELMEKAPYEKHS